MRAHVMAQHKAPTQVSIVTEEKSKFAQAVEKLALPFFVVFGLLAAWFVFTQVSEKKAAESAGEEWAKVNEARMESSAEIAKEAAAEAAGTDREAIVQLTRAGIARMYFDQATLEDAVAKIDAAKHPIFSDLTFPIGKEGAPITLAAKMKSRVADESKWLADHPILTNDAPPADAPVVVFETDAGAIRVQLYTDKAPLHAENFLARVREGYYDGQCFSRVIKNQTFWTIQAGDPESKNLDAVESWDRTNGPEEGVEREETGLVHDAGYLSMDVRPGTQESSGSQFFLTLRPAYQFDEGNVIFGKIVEGMDVARVIGDGEIRTGSESAQIQFAPVNPVVITGATIVE